MDIDELQHKLFPDGCKLQFDDAFVSGTGQLAGQSVAVIGTRKATPIGVEIAMQMAAAVLTVIRDHPGQPILLLVDTTGQRLSRRDELLGINHYLAHLAKCIEQARLRGHRIISLVYSVAISGGYLSTGMLADQCYALPDAEIQVMNLPAMSRVTKIPLETLECLSQTSPVFAPGVENYLAMGGLEALWETPLHEQLTQALQQPVAGDQRRQLGEQRGGRTLAKQVSERVRLDEWQ